MFRKTKVPNGATRDKNTVGERKRQKKSQTKIARDHIRREKVERKR